MWCSNESLDPKSFAFTSMQTRTFHTPPSTAPSHPESLSFGALLDFHSLFDGSLSIQIGRLDRATALLCERPNPNDPIRTSKRDEKTQKNIKLRSNLWNWFKWTWIIEFGSESSLGCVFQTSNGFSAFAIRVLLLTLPLSELYRRMSRGHRKPRHSSIYV